MMSASGNKCSYINCGKSKRSCQSIGRTLRMYRFPVRNKVLTEQWIANSGNASLADLSTNELGNKTICEDHFKMKSFANPATKHRLCQNTVPISYKDFAEQQKNIGRICCISGCTNTYEETRKHTETENTHYFTFPVEINQKQSWLPFCNSSVHNYTDDNTCVCSIHFTENDFVKDIQDIVLKSTAVPSVLALKQYSSTEPDNDLLEIKLEDLLEIPQTTNTSHKKIAEANTPGLDDFENVIIKQEVDDSAEYVITKTETPELNISNPIHNQNPLMDFQQQIIIKDEELKLRQDKINALEAKNKEYELIQINNHTTYTNELKVKNDLIKKLNIRISDCKSCSHLMNHVIAKQSIIKESKRILIKKDSKINDLIKIKTKQTKQLMKYKLGKQKTLNKLKQTFRPTQLNLVLGTKKKITWFSKDMWIAFKFLKLSGETCYNYLKNTMHYPLPELNTLNAWAKKISKHPTT